MVTILGLFTLFSGVIASFAVANNKYSFIKSISYFILGLSVLLLTEPFFSSDLDKPLLLHYGLISVLSISFFIGEITKTKVNIFWNLVPIVLAVVLIYALPDVTAISYMDFQIETREELLLVAALSSLTPFLTHLAKLGIGNLIIRFGTIKWAENEENYLEGLVSYAFIGGIASLGAFLIGPLGLLVSGTFYLSASLIARNKLGLKNKIILSAGSALFLLSFTPLLIQLGNFEGLNFLRGEVIQGAFFAGFLVIIHHLFILLARFNPGKWMYILSAFAILVPIVTIVALGMAYMQFERLGGVLSLAGLVAGLAILSTTFSLFKDASFVSLKLLTVGASLLLLPLIMPAEQTSLIDYEALGIVQGDEDNAPQGKSLEEAVGKWKIIESASKVNFELGPKDGRTKGEFKSLSGNFNISENTENSSVRVVMKLEQLTTYIGPRDKELMGDGYFKADKFPEITFESNNFVSKNGSYELHGDFTMMGVTKDLKVEMTLLAVTEENGEKRMILTGSSKVDRTEFGMAPSSKIGNVVDFKFEVQCELE